MAGRVGDRPETVALVPARYASTRFPGKPLAHIAGIPMILRVLQGISDSVDRAIVATDDKRIADLVESEGFRSVITGHADTGTERVFKAWEIMGCPGDIIINVQGDEPMVNGSWINPLVSAHDGGNSVVTLARWAEPDAVRGEDSVKVAVSDSGRAMYFSRSPIPSGAEMMLEHIGIYSFTPDSLRACVACGSTGLSRTERLEQLAWMESGIPVVVVSGDFPGVGVDTPRDLERAVEYFES